MASSLQEAQDTVKELAHKCLRVVNDPRMSMDSQKLKLDVLDAQLKAATAEVRNWQHVDAQRKRYGAQFLGDVNGAGRYGFNGGFSASTKSGGVFPIGTGPIEQFAPLGLDEYQMRQLHEAASTKTGMRVSVALKAAADASSAVPVQWGPPLQSVHEPFRVASLFPASSSDAPVVQFLRINGTANPATTVAAGGLKPDVGLTTEILECRAVKLAGLISTNDESLSDFGGWAALLTEEISASIVRLENQQILSGGGTGSDMLGLLNTPGILVHPMGTDTPLDALELAIDALRVGPSFADATAVVLHPSTWSAIRRSKATGSGQYLATDPLTGQADTLWGIKVGVTTDLAVGQGIVGNFAMGAQLYVREGLRVESSYGTAGFEHNQTTLRAEERIGLAVVRPSAFVSVTGLAGA